MTEDEYYLSNPLPSIESRYIIYYNLEDEYYLSNPLPELNPDISFILRTNVTFKPLTSSFFLGVTY